MTVTLIVLAHPEPQSFNSQWAEASRQASLALGHEVLFSDLLAMGFDPAERAAHYDTDGPFDPLKAQEQAALSGTLPEMIAQEVDKIRRADRIVFHFPLWWFAPPAILKGWCDRVLVHGALHDVDHRFDRGPCRGKTALFCVTTGASATEVGPDGKEGRLSYLLWPLAYTLRYCGFDIAEPVAAHGVHGYWKGTDKSALEAQLQSVLDGQTAILGDFSERPRWPFNADDEFDAEGRLRPRARRIWPFIGG